MAITFDNASSVQTLAAPGSLSLPLLIAGDYLFVVVGSDDVTPAAPSGVKYNGVAMSPLFSIIGSLISLTGWGLVAPAAGLHNIVATFPSPQRDVAMGGTSWIGVHPTAPVGMANTATGNSATPSVDIASVVGDIVVDGVYAMQTPIVIGPGQANRWKEEAIVGDSVFSGASSSEVAISSLTTMSWTIPSGFWSMGGITLKAATIGGQQLMGGIVM